jgi:polyhydroxybutyrate depolymerase
MSKKKNQSNFGKTLLMIMVSILVLSMILLLTFVIVYQISDLSTGTLVSSGEKREYLLYVPESYDPTAPTPLVLAFHGFAEWPAHEAHISRWNDLADEKGFIVVYPSGTSYPKRWRTMGLTNTVDDPQIDVDFISELIDHLSILYNIDPARVYANGLSNGGGMSYLLACRLSDRIAAIGSVAGAYTYPLQNCSPSRPVPLIAFHGTADPVVPFQGGPSESFDVPFPNVPAWMAAWAERNQCAQTSEFQVSANIRGVTYSDCAQNAEVVFYTIDGGGHTWPGGNPLPVWITGPTSTEIDATRVTWAFFEKHPMDN